MSRKVIRIHMGILLSVAVSFSCFRMPDVERDAPVRFRVDPEAIAYAVSAAATGKERTLILRVKPHFDKTLVYEAQCATFSDIQGDSGTKLSFRYTVETSFQSHSVDGQFIKRAVSHYTTPKNTVTSAEITDERGQVFGLTEMDIGVRLVNSETSDYVMSPLFPEGPVKPEDTWEQVLRTTSRASVLGAETDAKYVERTKWTFKGFVDVAGHRCAALVGEAVGMHVMETTIGGKPRFTELKEHSKVQRFFDYAEGIDILQIKTTTNTSTSRVGDEEYGPYTSITQNEWRLSESEQQK